MKKQLKYKKTYFTCFFFSFFLKTQNQKFVIEKLKAENCCTKIQ